MIVGGTAVAGSSKKVRKTYLRMVQNVQLTGVMPKIARREGPIIEFSEEDARCLHHPHDDALVVSLWVEDYNMHRVLVDNGSSTDILYYPAFQQKRIDRERLIPTNAPLVGFRGSRVFPLGAVTLSEMVGDYPQQITKNVTFLVVDYSSAYNAILGRPTLNSWKAVTSTYHLMIKFPIDYEVGELRGSQMAAHECYVAMMEMEDQVQALSIEEHRTGIEANPDKIQAIMEMAPPRNVKEVQSHNGKIAALNRFMSRVTDKCLPFFRTLKRSFEWTAECQQAFEELKAYLSSPPLLSPSQPGEELFLYLAVSPITISAALVREEEKVQKPVYYASRVLRGAEERYSLMEKLAFALVTAIELSEFDIQYHPRTAIKGQIVADFITEFTHDEDKGAEESSHWSIYTDGLSNRQAGGAGIILLSAEGDIIECMVRLDFPATNNESEYEALIAGLDLAKAVGAARVVIYCDSQVITNQINGDYECKGERMERYLDQLSPLIGPSNVQEIGSNSSWTAPLVSYLKDGVLPDGKEVARKLKVQAARFILIKDVLYKRGFSRPYLRCLGMEEANYVMREDDDKGTHRRDTVPTDVRKRSSHPGRSWAHELQGTQP
ncbi:uncharacterized protein LOC126705091 [Quercus robur]|uniref:uncharacterized protein LOC126705091 n=1 Tax=Quercus robur TaxID=38942 RepID=UPI00216275E0|nr:uncharacterized protein LOC126705091 [Quercus robur]